MLPLTILILTSLAAGWLLERAADYLPRFAINRPARLASPLIVRIGVMLLNVCAFAVLWAQMGLSWNLALYGGAYLFFLLIALIDLKYRLVLNIMVYPAGAVILLAQCALLRQNTLNVLLGGGLALAVFSLAAWVGDLGSGDIKLATLIGVLLGFPQVLWALLVGGGIGAAAAVYLLLRHRGAQMSMPYAPFLCLGAVVALLYNPIVLPM